MFIFSSLKNFCVSYFLADICRELFFTRKMMLWCQGCYVLFSVIKEKCIITNFSINTDSQCFQQLHALQPSNLKIETL